MQNAVRHNYMSLRGFSKLVVCVRTQIVFGSSGDGRNVWSLTDLERAQIEFA